MIKRNDKSMKTSKEKEKSRTFKQKQFTLDRFSIERLESLKDEMREEEKRSVSGSEIVRLALLHFEKTRIGKL